MIIRQAEGRPLGMSVDLVSSLINHSCDPNAFVVFERHTPCVRSLRKLVAGEEITQCYADVSMDVLSRQQVLKSKYFFDCRCKCAVLIK
jgi:SET domain-containing protein